MTDLLTEAERQVVTLLGRAASVFATEVLATGERPPSPARAENRAQDLAEFVDKVHQLQHAVMSQAAARAYPDTYRLLGDLLAPTVGDWVKGDLAHAERAVAAMEADDAAWMRRHRLDPDTGEELCRARSIADHTCDNRLGHAGLHHRAPTTEVPVQYLWADLDEPRAGGFLKGCPWLLAYDDSIGGEGEIACGARVAQAADWARCSAGHVFVPCDCGERTCEGWRALRYGEAVPPAVPAAAPPPPQRPTTDHVPSPADAPAHAAHAQERPHFPDPAASASTPETRGVPAAWETPTARRFLHPLIGLLTGWNVVGYLLAGRTAHALSVAALGCVGMYVLARRPRLTGIRPGDRTVPPGDRTWHDQPHQ